ncbi:MAG: acyl carrier protein [Burkholderiales bacterium]
MNTPPPIPIDDAALKLEIKRAILAAIESDIAPGAIGDDDMLVGENSTWITDSLDGLQAAVAVSKRFGVRIQDGKHARRVMRSVNTLAEFIRSRRP